MTLFKDTEILTKNPEFEFVSTGQDLHFITKSGHKVQTDSIGKSIWEILPGTPEEIRCSLFAAIPAFPAGHGFFCISRFPSVAHVQEN